MLRLLALLAAAGFLMLQTSSRSVANNSSRVGIDPQGNEVFYSTSTDAANPNYVNGIYSGQKYECVEYARRWLIRRGITFPSVRDATDLLSLQRAETLEGGAVNVVNANGLPPQVGDLLIYRATHANDHFGHVAVVVRVLSDRVHIGEQNHSGEKWQRDYSRSVPIVNGILSDSELAGVRRFVKLVK